MYNILKKNNLKTFASLSEMANPVVTVREGKLRGLKKHSFDGSSYYSFKAIPYAQPPVGKLRFKAPLPLKPWTGILDAFEHGPVCPQVNFFKRTIIEGSENCLFLNIYTRSLQPDSKMAVMVYFHGGAFTSGSGDDDINGPEFLLQHDIILVTINSRLEAFGFLCLDIPEVPGNAGLKDQILALRWIKNNISQFGGDPENVTIFGDSSGAASVTYHMVSPMANGLFNKVIAQSGTFLSHWALRDDAKQWSFRLGKYLGRDTKNPYDLLEFLHSVPSRKLIGISYKLITEIEYNQSLIAFTPVVEKEFPGSDSFLTENPLNLLLAGNIKKVPLLIGYNSAEGITFLLSELKKLKFKNKFPWYFVPKHVTDKVSEELSVDFGRRLLQFYFDNKKITEKDFEKISDLKGDQHLIYAVHRFSQFYAEVCKTIYMYRFNFDTEINCMKEAIGRKFQRGACHGDELFYIFNNSMNSKICEKRQDLKDHVYTVTKLWTDFAKTGNPTDENTLNIKWTPYTKSNKEYLRIEDTLSMGKGDEKERLDFWNNIYIDAGLPAINKSSL